MLWKQAVGPKPPPVPLEHGRTVTAAEVQRGHTIRLGFDPRVLRRLLASPSSLRNAILMQEILGPPKARRG